MEDTQAVSTTRVENIVTELAKLGVFRANVGVKAWPGRCCLQVEPHTVSLRAGAVISTEDIIGVSYPEAGWSLVSIEQTVRLASVNDEVILNQILCLNRVLNEHSVTHCLVVNIARDLKVVDTVECRASIVSLVD